MNKKLSIIRWTLLAMLTFVMAIGTISCSDNDKDTNEQKEEQQQQQSQLNLEFYNVMSKLAGIDDLPDDWQNMTFTATIGEPSQQSEATRIVSTNNAEAAALRFEDLTGASLGILNAYEWKRDFGTLTYKKSRDGQSWATVDVDIKQLPGLKRIVYCAPDQMGLNGKFDGNAYYRFGDIVTKPNSDGMTDYWICVRPAFGKEGKQDSHWITLNKLPRKNIYTYTNKGGTTHQLPTKLNCSLEHMGNLAEMLYAIMKPKDWKNYYNQWNDYMFHDFKEENIDYHNEYFWQLVQKAWDHYDIWNKALATNRQSLMNRQELTFFYSGYSWVFGSKGDVYTATYSGENFKELTKQTRSYDFKSKDKALWDINQWAETGTNAGYEPHDAYVVRYATGKQLMGSQPNEFMSMEGVNGIKDLYVFNNFYNQPIGKGKEYTPMVFTEIYLNPKATDTGFFQPGIVIKDEEGHLWMCYSGWYNMAVNPGDTIKTDGKARFISFDALEGDVEEIEYADTKGLFATNLVPEEQAYLLAFTLSEAANPSGAISRTLNASMNDVLGVNPKDLFLKRDTITTNSRNQIDTCHTFASNVAYIPTNGRMIGTQPILRYVRDETRVGKLRDHSIAYWYHYFYTKYTGDVNEFMFNRTMDVTDSYLWGESLEHGRVNADRWSINAWTDYNQIRRKVYEYADCMTIPYNYKNHAYDTQAHKWLNKRYYTAIPPYISSVYWEPIIIVAYMEIDDDDQLIFKSKYGNKKYTLISNPIDDNYEMAITSHPDILRKVIDPYTFVNEEPKTGYIYCW